MALDDTIPEDGDGQTTGVKVKELAGYIRQLKSDLNNGKLDKIMDNDGDTGWKVEESDDEDIIHGYAGGNERVRITADRVFYGLPVGYGEDSTERSTTSTTYVDEPNLRVDLNVKAGDIISVRLEGWFKNDTAGESVTVYPYVYSGTTDDLMTSVYIAVYSTKYQQKIVERLYKATLDETITFGMKWRVSSGTGYGRYRGLIANVIGNINY